MADTRYSNNVDLEHPTTSQSQAVLLVTPGSTVLDVGAADGSVARPLAARGCRVWAIELDTVAAAKARSSCERVIVGDVEQLDLDTVLEGQQFDFILLLDVVEHLRDPLALLARLLDRLAPGGRVIASIPNITHGAVRLSLMSGAFMYTETGLLDRTHLRFFDRRGAENLFAHARLRIVERLRVTRELTETEIPIDPSQFAPSVIQNLNEDPDATTYQFLLVGKPSEGEHIPEGVSLAEQLQREAHTVEAQYRKLEGYVRSLEQRQREAHTVEAQYRKLEGYARSLEQRQREAHTVEAQYRKLEGYARSLEQCQREAHTVEAQYRKLEGYARSLEQRQREAHTVETQYRELEGYARSLEQQHRAKVDELNSVVAYVKTVEEELVRIRASLGVLGIAPANLAEVVQHERAQAADVRAELEHRVAALHDQLQVLTNSAGVRIVANVRRSLNKYPRTYKMLQGVVRRVAGKPRE